MNVLLREIDAIITHSCGGLASRLVTEYFVHFRNKFNAILRELGLPSTICDPDQEAIKRGIARRESAATVEQYEQSGSFHTQLIHFLEDHSFGHFIWTWSVTQYQAQEMPEENLCEPFLAFGLSDILSGCFMLAHEQSTRVIFNILHFAHSARLPFMDYPQATVLKRLQMCINLIENNCGANYTDYLNFYYVVFRGTADIQIMMDNLTCEWQDTLITGYMQASEGVNPWPPLATMVGRPLYLSYGWFTSRGSADAMRDLWGHVCEGMPGIAQRCGREAASRIEGFYHKLTYAWYNFVKYLSSLPPS